MELPEGPFEAYGAVRSARNADGRVISKEINYEFHTDLPEYTIIDEEGNDQIVPASCRVFNHSDKER